MFNLPSMSPAAPFPMGHTADQPDASAGRLPIVKQYLRIAFRWRFVIAGIVGACLLIGVITTLLMTPKYTAVTVVEISREANKVTDFQSVEREASIADQEFYQTQYGLLRARSLSERVASQLRLADDAAFFDMFGVSGGDAFEQVNGRYVAAGRAARLRAAGQILLTHIAIEPTRMSRLVEIKFTSPSAQFSVEVANRWAQGFIETNLERKVQATSYGRNMLQKQLAQLKERLDQSQRQLVGYASAEQIINLPSQSSDGRASSERSIVADDLAAVNASLLQATTDRIQAQAKYEQVGSTGASTEALRNTAINYLRQRRAELASDYQRLMTQFTADYPAAKAVRSQLDQIDRSIAREEERVSGSLAGEFREASARERALQSRVDWLKRSFLDTRRRSIQYNIYQQEVDTNRALYDGVLQRFKEIGVAGGVGINNISIVDNAEKPEKPSSPRLIINLLIALLSGLISGGLAALVLEQIDEAIADPGEVERMLGLPLLGAVPKLRNEEPKTALQDRKSEMVDAYLAIQTNLEFTTERGVPRSLAVTSTRPAEGKSTTALALATMLSRARRSVILVDGDMRSPSVHHLGGVGHDHGLSNFLAGSDEIEPLLFEMTQLGFTAMSAGPIPPNAAELLTGARLPLLIERLLERFDHVVIDSPPVMGLADAPLIASRVEAVIFAVESHGIRSSLVRTALARLRVSHARVIGAVLTKFESGKSHYGYGYEYGYGYGRNPGDNG